MGLSYPMSENDLSERIDERRCPHCGSMIPIGASYCGFCTRRVFEYADCPECREPIAQDARFCPYCGERVRRYHTGKKRRLPALNLGLRGHRLGMLLRCGSFTGLIRPRIIHANNDRMLITTYAALGFDHQTQEVLMAEVADITLKKGFFWAAIVITPKEEGEWKAIVLRGFPKRESQVFVHRVHEELSQLQ